MTSPDPDAFSLRATPKLIDRMSAPAGNGKTVAEAMRELPPAKAMDLFLEGMPVRTQVSSYVYSLRGGERETDAALKALDALKAEGLSVRQTLQALGGLAKWVETHRLPDGDAAAL